MELTPQDREVIAGWATRLADLPSLFRYASIKGERFSWFYDVLLRSLLYFPKYSCLNDPFDGALNPNYGGTPEEIQAFWESWYAERGKAIDDEARAVIQGFIDRRDDPAVQHELRETMRREIGKFGVACFSEKPDDLPMWGYYADAHRGLCLRFRTASLWKPEWAGCTPPMPAIYEDEYPDVAFYRDSQFRTHSVLTLTKAEVWCHEREWRMVRHAGHGGVQFAPHALEGIIMGCRISPEDEARVRDMRGRRAPQIELLRARPAEREFKLDIIPA